MARKSDFRLRAQAVGSCPPVERQHKVERKGVLYPICSCRVPDVVVDQAWANLWFRSGQQVDPWVVRMIHIADVGFVD